MSMRNISEGMIMTRSEMITALKFRFPVNAPASWSRCAEKSLREWCQEYAILSEEERTNGVISVQYPLTGKWSKMYHHGIGKYPYHCERAETHPDAMVYYRELRHGYKEKR